MKKKLLLTIGILSFTVIVLASVLAHGRRVANSLRTTQILAYVRIVEGGTLSSHIEEVRQLAEIWEPPALSILYPTERGLQINRLREFAANLNAGGIEMSDLRIIEVANCSSMPNSVSVMFMHEDDYNNTELIAEMLDFTGICEDDIYIRLLTWGFKILAWEGHYEFMLPNQAVYNFLKPYLLLREFAMYANSGTIYRDEIVVTRITDFHQSLLIGSEIPQHLSLRYNVSLSPNSFNNKVKTEILVFAGLEANEVQFTEMAATNFFADFLLANEEWLHLSLQYERLRAFQDLIVVRSARHDTIMERVLERVFAADFHWKESGDPYFSVKMQECMYNNKELREALLAFTGIADDRISFELYEPCVFGQHMSRHSLTPAQLTDLETLEAYMEKVNAPFWYDRYQHDPVIVRIAMTCRSAQHGCVLREYIITLYDPDLIGRSRLGIAWHTRSLRADIIALTGVSNFRFIAQDTLRSSSFTASLLEGDGFAWFIVLTGVILWLLNIHGLIWIFTKRKESRIVDYSIIPAKSIIHPMYRFKKKLFLLPIACLLMAVFVINLLNPSGLWLRSDMFLWSIIVCFFLKTALGIYILANVIVITRS